MTASPQGEAFYVPFHQHNSFRLTAETANHRSPLRRVVRPSLSKVAFRCPHAHDDVGANCVRPNLFLVSFVEKSQHSYAQQNGFLRNTVLGRPFCADAGECIYPAKLISSKGYLYKNKKKPDQRMLIGNGNAAATYSPGPSPAKYHRRAEA